MANTLRTLPLTFVGADVALLPTVPLIDPIESAGSLLLTDLTHPKGGWAAGAPANGTKMPNLLGANALSILGSGVADDVKPTILRGAGWNGTDGILERTSKGGLHAGISETVAGGNTTFGVALPAALWTYIKSRAGATHDFYLSLWGRRTRVSTSPSQSVLAALASATVYHMALGSTTTFGTAPEATIARATPPTNALGAFRRSAAAVPHASLSGSNDSSNPHNTSIFTIGFGAGANQQTGSLSKTGSAVFYRAYLEDLTVSGRTYAQVDAIDALLYDAEVATPGGRYYGDTFTAPPA